ncbi:hypothetical protein TcasGA2_TC009335 [Tribolium castaneum]|uniref:Uncharacterized protein n=1 Tax=Tribolium castaneum TaxID=7070 RepID=D6WRH0_TRICA|nr:PREDICTED: uncharacterized protein LOC103313515 isoform X1 [Tribolium castaneum]EFA06453.1 hypothetical protein TcasGA2_TC009335 [Tribolium castaneum]|eukprot:XP_015836741.1 PREDICTED: uncharacterized protein LOC103313515 isoform X1 [Tribolium castaneum]
MRQYFVILLSLVAVAIAIPADINVRKNTQIRTRNTEPRQQSEENPAETPDPENASEMTNKILECRGILQQAGMIDLNQNAKPTEPTQPEGETEEPRKVEASLNIRRTGRRF